MDILKRNTDYSLRALINLAQHYNDGLQSTRKVSEQQKIPYSLACKLMQRLHKAKLVESVMGPKGGFRLSKSPVKINLLEAVEAIQGPISLNRCLLGDLKCSLKERCPLHPKLSELQKRLEEYLSGISLADLLKKDRDIRLEESKE